MSRKNMLMSIITTAVALALTLGAASCSAQLVPAQVYVISVDGTVELGLSQYVLRGLKQAQQDRAAVILEINTFGGRVDAAVEIRDYILRMETPVIAFVRERAISAGALI
ncbi:MAG: ATP-dependent Clp protease proteolytic subunit, partial [Limnochordia bacterium]